jgi:hypothetical protein
MTDFDDYEKIKEEVSKVIMDKLHPILKDIQAAQIRADRQRQSDKDEIKAAQDTAKNELKIFRDQMNPIIEVFTNMNGSFNVAKWMLIGLAAIGAGLGGLYAIIYEIKLFFRSH